MPKHKKLKPSYFFMMERKKQLEKEGHRFSGKHDLYAAHYSEWKNLPEENRKKYEQMALLVKEVRVATAEPVEPTIPVKKESPLDIFIGKLACDEQNGRRPEERVYIFIKCLTSVQVGSGKSKICYPAELALTAFSLCRGLLGHYWTLIDIVAPPIGYLRLATESCEKNGLPMPGSDHFEELYDARNYDLKVEKIIKFIKTFLIDYDDDEVTVFCRKEEIESSRLSLDWLIKNMKGEKHDAQNFLTDLKFSDLSVLMVKIAEYGKKINPNYRSELSDCKSQEVVDKILNNSSYNFRNEITCNYHRQGEAVAKMNFCCKNIVMKRMYLILNEFLPQYNITKSDKHDIATVVKRKHKEKESNIY